MFFLILYYFIGLFFFKKKKVEVELFDILKDKLLILLPYLKKKLCLVLHCFFFAPLSEKCAASKRYRGWPLFDDQTQVNGF